MAAKVTLPKDLSVTVANEANQNVTVESPSALPAHTIGSHSDANFAAATNKQLQQYNEDTGKWDAVTIPAAAVTAQQISNWDTAFGWGNHANSGYTVALGKATGQTVNGGTASGENLTLSSTNHATKGKIFFGANSVFDEATNRLAIGATSTSFNLQAETIYAPSFVYSPNFLAPNGINFGVAGGTTLMFGDTNFNLQVGRFTSLNPLARLEVIGGSNASTPVVWFKIYDESKYLIMTNAGKLGVNISSPSAWFDFKAGAANEVIMDIKTNAGSSVMKLDESSNAPRVGFYGVTPVVRQTVAVGSSINDVITALQTIGIFKES